MTATTKHNRRLIEAGLLGGVAMAIFIAAAIYGHASLRAVVESTDARKAARENLIQSEFVLSLLKDMETGQRGYLLTGRASYLAPYEVARREIGPLYGKLRERVAAVPGTRERIARLDELIPQRLTIAEKNVSLFRHQGWDAVRASLLSDEGKQTMDAIRREFDGLAQAMREEIALRNREVETRQQRALWATVALSLIGAGLLALAYGLLIHEQRRRRQAEQSLVEAAAAEAREHQRAEDKTRMADILESINDGFVALDRDWRYIYVNEQAATLLGRTDLVGRRYQDEWPEALDQPFFQSYQRVMQTRRPEVLETHNAPWKRWFENRIYPTEDGIAIYFTEITERKRAELALQDSERFRRELFENLPIGLALCRMNGELVEVNPAYAAILGRTVEATLGLTYWQITPESYAEQEQTQLAELEATGRYGPYEKAYRHADGHLVPVRLYGRIVEHEGERYIWSSAEDISDEKRAEAALAESNARLQAFASELDRSIEAERRRLAREVHDQLGQIFTALKIGLPSGQQPPARLDIEATRKLLDEGIAVSRRISADLRPPMLDDLGLAPALAHYAKAVAEQGGFDIALAVNDDARLDRDQANQLFRIAQEALTNVLRHAQAKRVGIEGAATDGHYVLRIEDDGRGFDPVRVRAGALGLIGIRERASLAGGECLLESPLDGSGTRISVTLPLATGND